MRDKRFTFLCNENERYLLSALAEYLQRSQGDTLRFLLGKAVEEMGLDPENANQDSQLPQAGK